MASVVLIHSTGRSGSNILLDSLDLSPHTHSRNEPDYDSSPLARNFTLRPFREANRNLDHHWDDAVRWMSNRWATKDRHHPRGASKAFYRPLWASLGLPKFLIEKNRTRRAIGLLYPPFRQEEFTLPGWILTPGWLERTTQVFKVNRATEYQVPWILENRPGIKHLFLVRHPLGFAQSIFRRFYTPENEQHYHRLNLETIRTGLDFAETLGLELPDVDVDSLDMFESTIWHWYVFNEITYQVCQNHPSVLTIVFEALLADPATHIQAAYEHCDLDWTPEIEAAVRETYKSSAHLALSFRESLDEEQQRLTEAMLSQSQIQSLWPDNLWEQLESMSHAQDASKPSYSPY